VKIAFSLYLWFGAHKLLMQSFDHDVNTRTPAHLFLLEFKHPTVQM